MQQIKQHGDCGGATDQTPPAQFFDLTSGAQKVEKDGESAVPRSATEYSFV